MNDYKYELQDTWRWRSQIYFVANGIKRCIWSGMFRLLALLYWAFIALFVILSIFSGCNWIEIFFQCLFAVVAFAVWMWFLGKPKGSIKAIHNFNRIGLINKTGETPLLIDTKYDGIHKSWKLLFRNCGIPLPVWNDNKENLESGLNLNIIDICERGKKYIEITATSGNTLLPDFIQWKKDDLSDIGFQLNLGKSVAGEVSVNIANTPHILIGGSTGSGKSVLLKCLLMQCIEKGANVIIADFKGGVDFPRVWREKAQIVTEREKLILTLDDIVTNLHFRKNLFADCECSNISEYNKMYNSNLKRLIFACDEVAELLDKTGMSKEDKAEIARVEANIATIARLGRAFGIHLILATQRPDANILSGQIKNNIDYRVCGRADDVLSQIILDKTDAADTISKLAQGRFLTYDGTQFQAYYFNDKEWNNGKQ